MTVPVPLPPPVTDLAASGRLWRQAAAETHTDEEARQRHRELLAAAGLLRHDLSHITGRTA